MGEKRLDLMFLQVPANAQAGYAPDSVDAVAGQVMTSTEDRWTAGGPLHADARFHPSKIALQTLFDHGVLGADDKGNQMAVWLTKITGYEKMSRTLKDDPTVKQLKDARKIKDKGAAAIVLTFDLMKPVNGSFNPGGRVTKAQAAEALLRLAEIQSQLDRPLWAWGYGSDASY